MGWLRLDDQFLRHPKVAPLNDAELRTLLAAMLYVASFRGTRDTGIVPEIALREVPGLTRNRVGKYLELGLWKPTNDGLGLIHDWHNYNPKDGTGAERQKRLRERKAGEDVTEASRERNGESNDGERDEIVTSRGRQRARSRPVPSSSPTSEGKGRDRSDTSATPADSAEQAPPPAEAKSGRVPAEHEGDYRSEKRGGPATVANLTQNGQVARDAVAPFQGAWSWLINEDGWRQDDWRYTAEVEFGVTDPTDMHALQLERDKLVAQEQTT